MNDLKGCLRDYDCDQCNNKGMIYFLKGSEVVARECDCMVERRNRKMIADSGISGMIDAYTFEKYIASEPWQKQILLTAKNFLLDHERKWLYACGQVGAGKTHLCTAVIGEFMKMGYGVKYMLWRDIATKLNAVVNDDAVYSKLIEPIKNTQVLYIDDFFKVGKGKIPTDGDVNRAFEIINYRYANPHLITVISSERTIADICAIDEAVGSRIYERAKNSNITIMPDTTRNYRLRGNA